MRIVIDNNNFAKINIENKFLAYKGLKDKNVLFIGSCRMTPLMYYFNNFFPDYNVYGIYIPVWVDRSNFSKNTIQEILNKTDFLITETARNYGILNTDKNQKNNFFENFSVNSTDIRLANLELHMYMHDLLNVYNITIENVADHFEKSKERIKKSLENNGQEYIWRFFIDNFKEIKMFSTHNHPTRVLSMLSFMHIVKSLNHNLEFKFIKKMFEFDFLEGNSSPVTNLDFEKYNFKFKTKIFENSILNSKNFHYQPTKEEKEVSDGTIEKILEAR